MTLKGQQSDVDEAKAYIEDLTKNIFQMAEDRQRRNEPVEEQPFEVIDWQAVYQKSVSATTFCRTVHRAML